MDSVTRSPAGNTLPWRGLMLDIARTFYPLPVLKRFLDEMDRLGLNVFHLHLTDDQGWRLAIPGRPELTAVSGQTAVAGGASGFLTVEDWADLNGYASERGITVVPEIDLPGHVNAALHACPELNPAGAPAPAYRGTGVGFSGLNVDLPSTERFLRDVIGAVSDMTPGEWIHIGGDECLSMPEEEYVALVGLAAQIVTDHGKKPIAWQEAALADLGPRLALQYWREAAGEPEHPSGLETDPGVRLGNRSRQALLRQAGRGAPVVLSPAQYAYFDMGYGPTVDPRRDWAGVIDLTKAGAWNPLTVLPGLEPANIMGAEACVWTEYINCETDLDEMLLPRLAVFAQVVGSGPDRSEAH